MSTPRVLLTSMFLRPGDATDRCLQEAGIETVVSPGPGDRTEEEMIALLEGIDGVVAGLDPFTERVLGSADRLRVIARTGVGYDTVDVRAATARGIVVCTTPGMNRHAVAEWAFALMLQCARKTMENLSGVKKGAWIKHEGMDMAGKTLGIVGLGTIGKEVAQRARAFEMRILAHDVVQDPSFAEEHGVSYVSLEQLLREADFVTLHLFLNSQSRHLINAERLAMMKPTAYLINTSRGGVVDTEALSEALREKRIAAAALDVFEEEPLRADSPLRGLDNAYLSPHMAGASTDTRSQSGPAAAENVIRVLRGERPISCVNPEVLG